MSASNRNARCLAVSPEYDDGPFAQMRWSQLAAILGCSSVLWSILIAGGWSLYRLFS